MVDSEKVQSIFRLIDIIIYIHVNEIEFKKIGTNIVELEACDDFTLYEEAPQIKFHTVLRNIQENNWFILAAHPLSNDSMRLFNASLNQTTERELTCTYTNNTRPSLLVTVYDDERKEYSTLRNYDDLDSQLFQLSTLYEDYIVLAMIIEHYVRNKIGEFSLPVNLSKLMAMDNSYINYISELYEKGAEYGV